MDDTFDINAGVPVTFVVTTDFAFGYGIIAAVGVTFEIEIISLASFEDLFSIDEDTERVPYASETLTLTPSFPLPIQHGAGSDTVSFRARFTTVNQPLAGNRSSAFTTR